MKRKAIEAIPLLSKMLKPTKEDYTAFSQILTVGEDKILILDLYETGKRFGTDIEQEVKPLKRYVTNGKDFETFRPGADKPWGKSGLQEEFYSHMPDIYFAEHSDKPIFKLLPKHSWQYRDTACDRLSENESDIKLERNRRKQEYHQNAIDRRIALVDKFPAGIEKWYKNLFKEDHFIFYETISSRKAIGTCSNCQKEVGYNRQETKPTHNESGRCPNCKVKVMYKAKGRLSRIEKEKKAIVMQQIPDGFVSRHVKLSYTASEYGETITSNEIARATYNGQRIYRDYSYTSWSTKNLCWTDSNTNSAAVGTGYLYTKNLAQVLEGTAFQYCAIGLLQEHTKGPIHQEEYLSCYESQPFLEYMIKMGLYRLVNEYVDHPWAANINSNSKRPEDIMSISRDKINRLIKLNGGIRTLNLLQLEEASGRQLADEEIKIIERYQIEIKSIIQATRYTTAGKLIRYAKKQLRNKKVAGNFISDWLDYIRMCTGAGLELNETLMFPRDLMAEHDKRTAEFKAIEDSEKNEMYQKLRKDYERLYRYQHGAYEILIPENLESIVQEGNNQHHCVGTYVNRVAKGESCILFVREKDQLDQAFYTMEVKDGVVVQCRGKYNLDPSPEIGKKVRKFVDRFQKYISNWKSQNRVQVPA